MTEARLTTPTTEHDLVAISALCAAECVRQHVDLGRVACLINALCYAQSRAGLAPTLEDALELARLAEPDSRGRFRTTPVTFASGGPSAAPSTITSALERLFEILDAEDNRDLAFEWVRQFELVHPFTDGNGRVGFVLYNWLMGSLDAPVPLPEFQF